MNDLSINNPKIVLMKTIRITKQRTGHKIIEKGKNEIATNHFTKSSIIDIGRALNVLMKNLDTNILQQNKG